MDLCHIHRRYKNDCRALWQITHHTYLSSKKNHCCNAVGEIRHCYQSEPVLPIGKVGASLERTSVGMLLWGYGYTSQPPAVPALGPNGAGTSRDFFQLAVTLHISFCSSLSGLSAGDSTSPIGTLWPKDRLINWVLHWASIESQRQQVWGVGQHPSPGGGGDKDQ